MSENIQKPIDFTEIAQLLWSKRKFITKVCAVMFVIAVVYAFSVPRTYTIKPQTGHIGKRTKAT